MGLVIVTAEGAVLGVSFGRPIVTIGDFSSQVTLSSTCYYEPRRWLLSVSGFWYWPVANPMCWSVCPEGALWQNGWLDLDAIWSGEWGRSKNGLSILDGSGDRRRGRGSFVGKCGASHCNQSGLGGMSGDAAFSKLLWDFLLTVVFFPLECCCLCCECRINNGSNYIHMSLKPFATMALYYNSTIIAHDRFCRLRCVFRRWNMRL